MVLCCGALSSFFVFLPAGGAGFLFFPVGSGLRAGAARIFNYAKEMSPPSFDLNPEKFTKTEGIRVS